MVYAQLSERWAYCYSGLDYCNIRHKEQSGSTVALLLQHSEYTIACICPGILEFAYRIFAWFFNCLVQEQAVEKTEHAIGEKQRLQLHRINPQLERRAPVSEQVGLLCTGRHKQFRAERFSRESTQSVNLIGWDVGPSWEQ